MHWVWNFPRQVNDWELEPLSVFVDLIYAIAVLGNGEDKLCWMPSAQRRFEVKFYSRVLVPKGDLTFPWRSIWKSKEPTRVSFFVWTVALGKILKIDNLQKSIIVVNWCLYVQKRLGDNWSSTPPALLPENWGLVFSVFGVHLVMLKGVIDMLACWQDWFGWHLNLEIWKAFPRCLMWCIWRGRNTRNFEGNERTVLH